MPTLAAPMILHLDQIEHEPVEFDGTLAMPDLAGETGEPLLVGGMHLAGTARRSNRGVELEARWQATVQLPCSRCLELYPMTLGDEIYLVLIVGPEEEGSAEQEMDLDETSVFRLETPRADLRLVAAEQLLLALPLKPLCRPDCAGLCSTCGANRNRIECGCRPSEVDLRLAALRDLRDRMKQ